MSTLPPTPELIAVDLVDSEIILNWDNDIQQRFHGPWLRDNARGADARHPENDQRLFDITELPADLSVDSASIRDGDLHVTFRADGYETTFPADWLWRNAYDKPEAKRDIRQFWAAAEAKSLPAHDYKALTEDNATMAAWLRQVHDYGFAIVSNVPTKPGMVCEVARLFGYVRETNYGELFEVRSEEKPTNLAFTGLGLNVHTDNPYRDPVPGLQLLHCLESVNEGGESVLMDGFKVAELLRQEDADAFDLLTRHWVPFRFRDDKADLQARRPLIEVDDRGDIQAIRYNNRSAAPFDLPADVMEAYYDAFRTYARLLHRPELELGLKLRPGDLMIFDNQRVLHGRKGFAGDKRHLQGCYADKDSLYSLMRKLEEA